jgi:Oxidoreductase NAD-binding domain
VHTLTRHEEGKHGVWEHFKGRVSEDMIKTHMPPPSPETLIGYCGPAEFNKAVE